MSAHLYHDARHCCARTPHQPTTWTLKSAAAGKHSNRRRESNSSTLPLASTLGDAKRPSTTKLPLAKSISKNTTACESSGESALIERCVVCCQPTDLSSERVKILSCSHRYHLSCLESSDETELRCVVCRKLWEDNSNLLDSATVHLPFDSFLLQQDSVHTPSTTTSKALPTSAFLRIGKALMDQDQSTSHAQLEPTSSEAQANGLALLFMLAQATDEEIDESSSDG